MRGVHPDVWDKTSNFFHFEGRGSDIKQYGFPSFYIPHVPIWTASQTCHDLLQVHHNLIKAPLTLSAACFEKHCV